MTYRIVPSPVGRLLVAGDADGLRLLAFADADRRFAPAPGWRHDEGCFEHVCAELDAYFRGVLRRFTVPARPEGTPFQRRVWAALCDIPYGETTSYGALARQLGDANAVRAVGLANGANPIAIIIPCHRVIGSNGRLVGYGGGLPIKQALLDLERGQRRLI